MRKIATLLPLAFLTALLVVGNYFLLKTITSRKPVAPPKLESSASEESTFRLFSPGWRGLGPEGSNAALNFTEIYGNQNPKNIHDANPNAKSYKYTLGPYVTAPLVPCSIMPSENPNAKNCGKATNVLPESALAKDSRGKVVYAEGFKNNFLVVPDDPAWLNFLKTKTVNDVTFSPGNYYDGILTDSMGSAPVDSNYLNAKPIFPGTSRVYTRAEWLNAEVKMLRDGKREGLPSGKALILNGLHNGDKYWEEPVANSPRVLLSQVDGAMAEVIFRSPKSSITSWPSVSSWLNDVRMIEDVEKTYHLKGYWWTKCWSSEGSCKNDSASNKDALISQWLRFALSSYLLGAGPSSYFNFDTTINDGNAAEYFPEYDKAKLLGTATGERQEIGSGTNVYKRTFSNGLVLVNPTDTSKTVPFAGTYTDLKGQAVTSTVTLPGHSGEILLGESQPITPTPPTPTCIPRPDCFDMVPACNMPVPPGGFCPVSGSGLTGLSYGLDNFTGFARGIDPVINLNLPGKKNLGIIWLGKLSVPQTGEYTFFTELSGVAEVWIDGNLIVSNSQSGLAGEYSGRATLSSDQQHDIKILYYTLELPPGVKVAERLASMKLLWSGPGINKQIIQSENLFPFAVIVE